MQGSAVTGDETDCGHGDRNNEKPRRKGKF